MRWSRRQSPPVCARRTCTGERPRARTGRMTLVQYSFSRRVSNLSLQGRKVVYDEPPSYFGQHRRVKLFRAAPKGQEAEGLAPPVVDPLPPRAHDERVLPHLSTKGVRQREGKQKKGATRRVRTALEADGHAATLPLVELWAWLHLVPVIDLPPPPARVSPRGRAHGVRSPRELSRSYFPSAVRE